jgi:hypothetical protein
MATFNSTIQLSSAFVVNPNVNERYIFYKIYKSFSRNLSFIPICQLKHGQTKSWYQTKVNLGR